nr:hypothetical protein GCM10020093_114080 [Planobispora longispora]
MALELPDVPGQAAGEMDAPRGDPEEDDVLAALGAFEDLVGDADQRPVDVGAFEDRVRRCVGTRNSLGQENTTFPASRDGS